MSRPGATAPAPIRSARPIAAWATVHGLAHLLLDEQIPSVRGDRAAAERLIAEILGQNR